MQGWTLHTDLAASSSTSNPRELLALETLVQLLGA
jgi:hypothetical protein